MFGVLICCKKCFFTEVEDSSKYFLDLLKNSILRFVSCIFPFNVSPSFFFRPRPSPAAEPVLIGGEQPHQQQQQCSCHWRNSCSNHSCRSATAAAATAKLLITAATPQRRHQPQLHPSSQQPQQPGEQLYFGIFCHPKTLIWLSKSPTQLSNL